MAALRAAHKELDTARRLAGGRDQVDASHGGRVYVRLNALSVGSRGSALGPSRLIEFTTCLVFVPNRPHADTVHGQFGVHSSQQNSQSREAGCKQRELEQLRRENQVYTHLVEYTP